MNKGISIAIIDNGINELLIKRGVEKSITIDEHGICIDDAKYRSAAISAWNKLCDDIGEILY